MSDSWQQCKMTAMALPQPGDLLAGKYRVTRVLGRGGMGVVLAAHNELLDIPIAVKVLHDTVLADPSARRRFEREARAAAKLQSDHVARVLDVGELAGGEPYIVMEMLHGADLSDAVSKGRFSVVEAVDAVLEACDAVAEAHSLGIVHRDLKPANLFRARQSDGSDRIKVLDFGISKRLELATPATTDGKPLTAAAQLLGSPYYMSPEQLSDAVNVDYRADVWAFGVILFELLVGSSPFAAGNLAQVFAAILERPSPNLRALRPDVPEALERVILCCLEKRIENRYPNASALSAALAPFGSWATSRAVERATRFGTTRAPTAALTAARPAEPPTAKQSSVGQTVRVEPPAAPGFQTAAGWDTDIPRSSNTIWIVGGVGLVAMVVAGSIFFTRSNEPAGALSNKLRDSESALSEPSATASAAVFPVEPVIVASSSAALLEGATVPASASASASASAPTKSVPNIKTNPKPRSTRPNFNDPD